MSVLRLASTALSAALLAACAAGPRPAALPPTPDTAAAPAASPGVTADAIAPIAPPTSATPDTVPTPPDLWARVRAGLDFADCGAEPRRTRWERIYTRGPEHFAQMLARALPTLEYVAREVESRGLPMELVLLPIVESQYQPVRGPGGVAGIWQMAPETARAFGVAIDPTYDGRLDLVASTRGALDLLEHLERQFPEDWRLADLAYNAGQYRVLRALIVNQRAGRPTRADALALSTTSFEHLAKVEALACIVREPERFRVELPVPDEAARLTAVALDAPIDLELAARLAEVSVDDLRKLNAGWLASRIDRAGAALMLPAARADAFAARLATLPAEWRGDFVYARLHTPLSWESLAATSGESAPLIAALNGRGAGAAIPAGTRLFLPQYLLASIPAVAEQRAVPARESEPVPKSYRVRAGDSLWTIARRFRLGVDKLRAWNALPGSAALKPGQVLSLAPR